MSDKAQTPPMTAAAASRLMANPRSGSLFVLPDRSPVSQAGARSIQLPNKRITHETEDFLYHLGLSSHMDLRAMFGDTKIVCMGGSAERAYRLALKLVDRLGITIPTGLGVTPVGKTERYSLYKVGPVISVNHGMGMPSLSILLHELVKLLHHADASGVIFMRIGTSGGIGIPGGTVVVAEEALNEELEPMFKQIVLLKQRSYPSKLDPEMATLAVKLAAGGDGVPAVPCVKGKTLGTHDFYEGQARLDGATCDYTEEDKNEWLKKLDAAGVSNIEMESTLFAAFLARVDIPAVLINAVLLNRLQGDQVTATKEELQQTSDNAQEVALRLICHLLLTQK